MSDLAQQINDDLKTAMREKNSVALTVLRGLKSALKYAAIEQGGADAELNDTEAIAVVRKQIKQRQDSIESFQSGGRDDLIATEKAELEVLENYLPAGLSEDEVAAMVEAAIAETGAESRKDMGAVMKILQERTAGRADNKTLSQLVMAKLS
jgi:uncharacterized protein YqeY